MMVNGYNENGVLVLFVSKLYRCWYRYDVGHMYVHVGACQKSKASWIFERRISDRNQLLIVQGEHKRTKIISLDHNNDNFTIH
jgi:hypothetical protein